MVPRVWEAVWVDSMASSTTDRRDTLHRLFRDLMRPETVADGPVPISPQAIGPYRVVDLLGRGGMGEVFLAERSSPVHMRVALKVIKLGMDSREVLARFEQERRALELMAHGAIARVPDAGTTELGQPYFVMDYIAGVHLTDYCRHHELATQARIELLCRVCDGVQHAHSRGIIHRDLKPSNVLVVHEHGEGRPKIIDFGLARLLQREAGISVTELGRLLGTPEYMSPEQARGDLTQIDARTDVFALGVMLYELLCDELPLGTADLRRLPPSEIPRVVANYEVRRPSTRVRGLASDLDWIALCTLAKEPKRRYATPNALALDLRKHLSGEPIDARPPSFGYRLGKLIGKYRVRVAVAALAALVLLVSAVVVPLLLADVARAEERGRQHQARAAMQAAVSERRAGGWA